MRGIELSVLRTKVKAEIQHSQETNSTFDTEINYMLASQQQYFASMFDWVFLKDKWDLVLSTGDRYVSVPTTNDRALTSTINFARPVLVERLYNGLYNEMCYGIGSEQYTAIHIGTNQDPVQRWELATNVGDSTYPNQLEVWPSPSTAQIIRFTGQRELRALSSDTDKCDLDDYLLIYFVAANYLISRKMDDGPAKLQMANNHLTHLRAGYPTDAKTVIFGRNQSQKRLPVKLIATA